MDVQLTYKKVVKIREPLTDTQWSDLKKLSALPDKARLHVDWAIAYYRECRSDELGPSASEARERFRRIQRATAAYSKALVEIITSNRLLVAYAGGEKEKTKTRNSLERLQQDVAMFGKKLKQATSTLKEDRRGPKRDALGQAMIHLNLILIENTGRPLNTLKKSKDGYGPSMFALKVMQIADKSLKESSVPNKIRQLEEEMDYWDDDYKPWSGLDLKVPPTVKG